MANPNKIKQYQYSDSIQRRYWDEKYAFENFQNNGATSLVGGGAAGGTAGNVNVLILPTTAFEYAILGTQTITAPVITVNGLNLGSMDQTANDGLELNHGVLTSQPTAFKVGTDPAFFFRVRFTIADVSGTDDCAIGFRQCEANQANVDDYQNMAVLNVISGNIFIETILANAATVSTDTTNNWADTETHELMVLVSETGAVTYTIDGSAPLVTAADSFPAATFVMPFVYFLQDTDIAGAVPVAVWECGYQTNVAVA
jgi:hypothetical protein